MNCAEANKLINAYLDLQLDAAHAVKVEQHIDNCTKCMASYHELSNLQAKLKSHMAFYPAPDTLKKQILTKFKTQPAMTRLNSDTTSLSNKSRVRQSIAIAASLVIGFIVVFSYQQHRSEEAFISEVLSSHIRAISANRYADIKSSATNTIIPWFTQKINFSPKIFNFSEQGYELAGGRLDSFQHQPIAAITYKNKNSLINVYTWPSPEIDDAPQESHNKQGYYLLYWCQNNMNYWIVSDGENKKVDQLAKLIRERLSRSK